MTTTVTISAQTMTMRPSFQLAAVPGTQSANAGNFAVRAASIAGGASLEPVDFQSVASLPVVPVLIIERL
jgi:hypothetical protein